MFIIVDVKGKDFTFKIWKKSGSCLEGKKNKENENGQKKNPLEMQ